MSRIPHRETIRGFTLIEMLVVLMIMGLFVGWVSAISRPDERAILHAEAERLARLLELAAAESRLTGKSIAWTAEGSGYRFWRLLGTGWSEIHDNDLLRARELPPGTRVSGMSIENVPQQEERRLEFVPYLPTPVYSIELTLGAVRYAIAGSPVGNVRILQAEGIAHGAMAAW